MSTMLRASAIVSRKGKNQKMPKPGNTNTNTKKPEPEVPVTVPVQPQDKKPCDLVLNDLEFNLSLGLARMNRNLASLFLATSSESGTRNVSDQLKSLKYLKVDTELGVDVTKPCVSAKVSQRIIQRVRLFNPKCPNIHANTTLDDTKKAQSEYLCSVLKGLNPGLDDVSKLEVWFPKAKDGSNDCWWRFTDEKTVELGLKQLTDDEFEWSSFDLRSFKQYINKQRINEPKSQKTFVVHAWEVRKTLITKWVKGDCGVGAGAGAGAGAGGKVTS